MNSLQKGLLFLMAALFAPSETSETWKTIQYWSSPASMACGVAWDGRHLWHGESRGPGVLYKTDAKSGRLISRVTTAMSDPGDIEWLDGYMWVSEENKKTRLDGTNGYCVVKIDPKTGATVDDVHVDVPQEGGQCEAVTTDGRYLYVSYHGHWIIKLDPVSKKTVSTIELGWANADLTGNAYYLDGLCWAFGHIFAVTNVPLSINEIDPTSGNKLAEFKAPAGEGWGPEGLATDGNALYYAEYNNDRFYKILLIDGYFR